MNRLKFINKKAIDFCDDVRDGTHDSPKHLESGKLLITSKNIKNGYVDLKNASYISEEDFNKINKRSKVNRNDILYSMIGTVGLVHRVDVEPDYAIKNIGLFKIKNELKSKWLYYYLNTPDIINSVNSKLNGSTQKFISLDNLRNLDIKYPENEQDAKRIIKILETIDLKMKLNNQINNNLSEQIKSIYDEIFNEYVDYKRLDEISNVTIGKTPPRREQECFTANKNDIKWVSISDLGKSGMFVFDTSEKLTRESIDKYNVKVIPKDTVILSFKLTVGRTGFITENMTTNEAIAHFDLNNKKLNNYLYCTLTYFNYSDLGSTSSIATAINSKIIKSIKIGMPSEEQLNKFNNLTSAMFKSIKNNEAENIKLSELRDALLPKLMNGEIDLDNIEI